MMHKILFIPQWYPPIDKNNSFSGIFNRELVMSAALYDQVAVLSYKHRKQRLPTLRIQKIFDDGVPSWYATYGLSPIPKTSFLSYKINLFRAITHIIKEWGKPDIIHSQDSYAYYVIQCTQHLNIPHVISQHWTGLTANRITKRKMRQFRWAFKKASFVLPANKYAEEQYKQLGLLANVRWLPNALNTDIFFPTDQPREKWLLHVSGMTPQKRVPDIIRAFSHVVEREPKAKLQFVGDGDATPEMKMLAESALPPGSYHFHGNLTKPEVADLMRRSSGFVFPSDYETFGCVLMEAMACGLPVLTTKAGGIPAVVGEGQGLFVKVGDIEAIAHGMLKMLNGTHGIDTEEVSKDVRSRFSRQTVGKILHEIYKEAKHNN